MCHLQKSPLWQIPAIHYPHHLKKQNKKGPLIVPRYILFRNWLFILSLSLPLSLFELKLSSQYIEYNDTQCYICENASNPPSLPPSTLLPSFFLALPSPPPLKSKSCPIQKQKYDSDFGSVQSNVCSQEQVFSSACVVYPHCETNDSDKTLKQLYQGKLKCVVLYISVSLNGVKNLSKISDSF